MNISHWFKRGFALLFVLFLLLNSIAALGEGISIGGAVTSFAISIGIAVAGEALWRVMRRSS